MDNANKINLHAVFCLVVVNGHFQGLNSSANFLDSEKLLGLFLRHHARSYEKQEKERKSLHRKLLIAVLAAENSSKTSVTINNARISRNDDCLGNRVDEIHAIVNSLN